MQSAQLLERYHNTWTVSGLEKRSQLMTCCAEIFITSESGKRVLNIVRGIKLMQEARDGLYRESYHFARCLMNEGSARMRLADYGEQTTENLAIARNLEESARLLLGKCTQNLSIFDIDDYWMCYGYCLMNEGLCLTKIAHQDSRERHQLDMAVNRFECAREIFPAGSFASGQCLLHEASALRSLADTGMSASDVSKTLLRCLEMLDESEKLFKNAPEQLFECKINKSITFTDLGNLGIDPIAKLEDAIKACDEAIDLLNRHDDFYGSCLLNKGRSLKLLSEWQGRTISKSLAINSYKKAIDCYKNSRLYFSPKSHDYATSLMNEGNVRTNLSNLRADPAPDLREAVTLYQEASARVPEKSLDYGRCYMNASVTLKRLTEWERIDYFRLDQCHDFLDKALGVLPNKGIDYARSLMDQAYLFDLQFRLHIGDNSDFRPHEQRFRDAAHALEQAGGLADASQCRAGLAGVFRERRMWREARSAWLEAIDSLERSQSASLLSHDRDTIRRQHNHFYDGLIESCLYLNDAPGALEAAEKGRGRLLSDLLASDQATPQGIEAEKVQAYRAAQALAEALRARLGNHLLSMDEKSKIRSELDDQRRNLIKWGNEFRVADPDFLPSASPPNATEIRRIAQSVNMTLVYPCVGEDRADAIVVDPNGLIRLIALPGLRADRLQSWVDGRNEHSMEAEASDAWLNTYIHYRDSKNNKHAIQRKIAYAKWLKVIETTPGRIWEEIVGPIVKELGTQPRKIAILCNGQLGMLPIHLARFPGPNGNRWLCDEWEICYVPSSNALLRCSERNQPAWTPGIAVMSSHGLKFNEYIISSIKKHVEFASKNATIVSLIGAKIEKGSVEATLPRSAFAHFSCHGTWNPDFPPQSKLQLEDFSLTIEDLLYRVRVDKARLVVLSACDSSSGFGEGTSSDAYLGFPAAFLLAGARTVIGAQWAVPSVSTALLMPRLYAGLLKGQSPTQALARAQSEIRAMTWDQAEIEVKQASPRNPEDHWEWILEHDLDKNSSTPFGHPYYWGAFAVYGLPIPLTSG